MRVNALLLHLNQDSRSFPLFRNLTRDKIQMFRRRSVHINSLNAHHTRRSARRSYRNSVDTQADARPAIDLNPAGTLLAHSLKPAANLSHLPLRHPAPAPRSLRHRRRKLH
jgi:hypothetical protein